MKKIKTKLEKSEFIPYGRQDIRPQDIESVIDILNSDFITQGPAVPVFEKKLCDYTGAKYSVAVNSCTSALHIACLALDLGPGDILWTSPITFVASVNCALYCGANVDFVDIEPDTALMSIEKLKEKLEWAEKEGKLPKIVVPVHFAGQPCDMKEIYTLGQHYNFKIIEDAAHAIGAKYQGNPVGNCHYSDISVFSFHPVKIITTGEGGASMTNNPIIYERMKVLRSHGITRDPLVMRKQHEKSWYYEQIDLGFNYRMTDIQAALGSSQITRLDEYVLRRTDIAEWYDKQFEDISIIDPLSQKAERKSAHHLYVIKVISEKKIRDKVYEFLREKNIGVNLHYMPVYKHPYHQMKYTISKKNNAEHYFDRTFTLPIFQGLSNNHTNFVVDSLLEAVLSS